jgi:hypothetical protein
LWYVQSRKNTDKTKWRISNDTSWRHIGHLKPVDLSLFTDDVIYVWMHVSKKREENQRHGPNNYQEIALFFHCWIEALSSNMRNFVSLENGTVNLIKQSHGVLYVRRCTGFLYPIYCFVYSDHVFTFPMVDWSTHGTARLRVIITVYFYCFFSGCSVQGTTPLM